MYVNNFDKNGQCAKSGNSAEESFNKILIKRGEVRPATRSEQFKHIDFFLTIGDKIVTYDVKARKKTQRDDTSTNDEWVWVEFKNVAGRTGWIDSSVDFLAFEQENSFIVVSREKLKELCLKICDLNSLVTKSSEAHYKAYQRVGRKDIISLIKTSDILSIAEEVVLKN